MNAVRGAAPMAPLPPDPSASISREPVGVPRSLCTSLRDGGTTLRARPWNP